MMVDLGYRPSDSRDPATPQGIGNLMVDIAPASRHGDGSNFENGWGQITSATCLELYDRPRHSAVGGDSRRDGPRLSLSG